MCLAAVAQTFLSAGSRCFPAPCPSSWGLESPQNPQTRMSALRGKDALNRYGRGPSALRFGCDSVALCSVKPGSFNRFSGFSRVNEFPGTDCSSNNHQTYEAPDFSPQTGPVVPAF